jgi:hypothetical protein
MQNQVITNTQPSVLDLSPLQNAHGAALVLRPTGQAGASMEITAEVAANETVARVKKAGWVDLKPAAAAAPPPPTPAPAPVAAPPPVAAAPPPPPAPAPVATPLPEPTQVIPPDELAPLIEQTKVPEASEVPAKVTRSRK